MSIALVIGDLRVQVIYRGDGGRSYTIFTADGDLHTVADSFLRQCGDGTDRTYAYLLVDHLRWLEAQALDCREVTLAEVSRYMGAIGAKVAGPFASPWRTGKRPYGHSTLKSAAACLKMFYLHQDAMFGHNRRLAQQLDRTRLPSKADRNRRLLGHLNTPVPANPLAPKVFHRRHPKLPPAGAKPRLLATLRTARDRLVVTWLADSGMRIGELCGLHLVDLHMRDDADCGQCRTPHVHICHRAGNPNQAAAKTKPDWQLRDGVICGGIIKRVSPAMVHTYFSYMTSEYPADTGHGMLLVQLAGPRYGQPWTPAAARVMMRRAGIRAGLGRVRPHSWRHRFGTMILNRTKGNLVIARDAGGWSSVTTVQDIYWHADLHDPQFELALQHTWDQDR